MHIPLWTTVLHAAYYNAGSVTARSNSEGICLPYDLQTAVPNCALNCIQEFILNNYHTQTCSSTADLSFLCTTETTSGLTIGEGSLQCVISNCLGADIEKSSGYTVCDGVYGAIPNMAETITATVSDITTLLSSSSASASTAESTALTLSLSEIPPSSMTSVPLVPLPTETSVSKPPATTLQTSTAVESSSGPVVSAATSNDVVLSASSSIDRSATITTRKPSSTTSSTSTTRLNSSSETRSTGTASATAVAATESAQKAELSPSAIAGIATASVIVAALVLGYLAYMFIVRRKEKQRRRSLRFSTFLPPQPDDAAGSAPPAVAESLQGSSLPSPTKRFYAGEAAQDERRSFWRRSFHPPPQDIGVAVAPSTRIDVAPAPSTTRTPWPPRVQSLVNQQARSMVEDHRWSVATSFDEDVEAHSQDIPILGNPNTRFSGRSYSSAGRVEKPVPLHLSRVKSRSETPPSARMPLTPVYDNGNFESIVRQKIEDPFVDRQTSTMRQSRQPQTLNFSRREPSLTRTSQDQSGPLATQVRQRNPAGRFPVRIPINGRKQSVVSNQSVSVHTDIEENDTPEQEEDKQLAEPPAANPAAKRQPLRDLQWPQVPRPAAVAKQSQKVHSPRAGMTIRQVKPSPETLQALAENATRDQLVREGRSFVKTQTSSSSDILSQSSASTVFPTPPSHRRTGAQADLIRQIPVAYKAVSRPTAATTPTRSSRQRNPEMVFRPAAPQPGQMYQQIQRLNTGRPLAQKLQAQGYMPRPMARSNSRAKITPMTSRSGDLYLTVGGMEQ